MPNLTTFQITEFARTVARSANLIEAFYANPENEQAYQEWYFRKFGRHEGDPA